MTDMQIQKIQRPEISPRQPVAILGIGTANPPAIAQIQAAQLAESFSCQTPAQSAWLQRIFSKSGVEFRGTVLKNDITHDDLESIRQFYSTPQSAGPRGPSTHTRMQRYALEAPPLMERAARAALRNADTQPHQITHIITASCTGFTAPGLDYQLMTRLNLRPDVRRTNVGFMGCHAGFNAMAAARDTVRAEPDAVVLVCSVELSTLHFAYGWNPEKLIANALFADGASACVIADTQHLPAKSRGGIEHNQWKLLETTSLLLPNSANAMTWTIGDHGFEMTLSSELPALIGHHIRPWCDAWLKSLGLTRQDISRWAIHPGGPRILEAARQALQLHPADIQPSLDVLARHGNMSSATLLFLLQHLAAQPHNHGLCVAIGFGPGLMAEGMLLQI